MGHITVRPAEPSDHSFVNGLFADCNGFYCGLAPHLYRFVDNPAPPVIFKALTGIHAMARAFNCAGLANSRIGKAIFVAELDSAPAGAVFVEGAGHETSKTGQSPRTATLDNLFVAEPLRHHGVGSSLLQRGLDWAEQTGHVSVEIKEPSNNELGLAFLKGHGFQDERAIMGVNTGVLDPLGFGVHIECKDVFTLAKNGRLSWSAFESVARLDGTRLKRLMDHYPGHEVTPAFFILEDIRAKGHEYVEAVLDRNDDDIMALLERAGFDKTHRVLGFDFD